jgi:hypothetical protein
MHRQCFAPDNFYSCVTGLKLAERGGKSGKTRAIIATARKLAVLLHRLWVSGEVYEPLHNSSPVPLPAAA